MSENDDKACSHGDELVVGPSLGDGHHAYVRHKGDHEIEAGVFRVVQEGQPIHGEPIIIEPQEGSHAFRVRSLEAALPLTKGPSKAATDAYRNGWDNLFGKKSPVAQA